MPKSLLPLIFSLPFLLGLLLPAPLAADVPDRPNVIVIFLDDSGYGDYAHHGNPLVETPNISRLAAEGAQFTQFYVPSPACSASRYSLLTGRYPTRSELGSWVVGPESKNHLLARETTLAEGFKSRGYQTAFFGKWHLGTPNAANGFTPEALPLAHGFDRWLGTNVSHDYADAQLLISDSSSKSPYAGYRRLADRLPEHPDVCASLVDRYTGAAASFIRQQGEQPYFLYLAHNFPHLGLFVSDRFKDRSRRGLFGDVMAEIDDSVGRILEAVRQSGQQHRTLIVFSSDNGPWIRFQNTVGNARYGEAGLNIGYAYPFRDGKGSNWEGGHRVVGIFHWPGVIPPSRRLEPASTLDVLPTLFALGRIPLPPRVDGRDIRSLLSPRLSATPPPPFQFAYCGPANQPAAFRSGPWKLHIHLNSQIPPDHDFTASPEKPLLFQLEHDPGERFDRAAEQPEVTRRLQNELEALRKKLTP